MKKLFLFLLVITFYTNLSAQSFYVCEAIFHQGTFDYTYKIHKVTITPNGVQSVETNSCTSGFYSVAATPQGFYWLDGVALFKGELDDAANTLTNCNFYAGTIANSNSLVAGPGDKLYYASGYRLYVSDVKTRISTEIGDMGYVPSGDFTFYKGELYMAADEGLIKVNAQSAATEIYLPLAKSDYGSIYGLVTLATGLRKNTVYALAINAKTRGTTDIYELDMENKSVVRKVGTLPFEANDAASPYEDGSIIGINIEKINIRQDCSAPNAGIAEIVTTTHHTPFTYILSNGQTNTTGIFPGLPAGNYQVDIKSPDDEQTGNFTVPPYTLAVPAYSYVKKNQVCDAPGQIVFSTPAGSSTYKIQLSSSTFPLDHTFNNLEANTYHFAIINDNGCQVGQEDITLPRDKCTIQFDKAVTAKECTAINKGRISVLTNSHFDTYTYVLNGVTNTTGVFYFLDPGDYSITINSPEDSKTITATIPDYSLNKPTTVIDTQLPVCSITGQITLSISDAELYNVSFNSSVYPANHVFTGLPSGNYHFDILTKNGCIVDAIDVILAQDVCSPVVFPTAFTPNGDGVNDIFRPDPSSKAANFTFSVFDRWGALIFYSKSFSVGWDGTFKGAPAPVSTYYWVASFITQEKKRQTKGGTFALIR